MARGRRTPAKERQLPPREHPRLRPRPRPRTDPTRRHLLPSQRTARCTPGRHRWHRQVSAEADRCTSARRAAYHVSRKATPASSGRTIRSLHNTRTCTRLCIVEGQAARKDGPTPNLVAISLYRNARLSYVVVSPAAKARKKLSRLPKERQSPKSDTPSMEYLSPSDAADQAGLVNAPCSAQRQPPWCDTAVCGCAHGDTRTR